MKWTIRLGKVFGIELSMHLTFLLLLLFVGISEYRESGTLAGAMAGMAFMVAVFAIVVLHELGHAVTALRFGVRTRDIILLPIGGVARLERMPERPLHELLVAVAGPAVNVVLGLLLALAATVLARPILVDWALPLDANTVLGRLVWVNVSLFAFNLIPAFPMDGGRVLRALLAMRMDRVRATRAAARLGQAIALLLGFVGLMVNPMLALIAAFIWITAAAESASVETSALLAGATVREAMVTSFEALDASDTLAGAADRLLAGSQVDFPVLDRGQLVGVLTSAALVAGLARAGREQRVSQVMDATLAVANPDDALEPAIGRLKAPLTRTLPVVEDGRVIGLLTLENVTELLAVRGALRARPGG